VDSLSVSASLFGPVLTWPAMDTSAIVKYYIFRSADSTTSELHDSTVSTELTHTDIYALRDTEYYYRVAGGDVTSDFGSLSTYGTGVIIPFELEHDFVDVDVNELSLSWALYPEETIDEYLIYRSENGSNFTLIDSVSSVDTAYTDTGLQEGEQYWYKLKAENNEGARTSFFHTDSVFTRLITPTNLVSAAISENRIDLTWVDNTDEEDGYLLQRRFVEVEVWALVDSLPAGAIDYADSSLSPSTVYAFQVVAYNDSGAVSDPSNTSITMTDFAANTSYGTITSITDLEGLVSDTVTVNYYTEDPNGSYAITQDWQYSRDGTTWLDLAATEILDNSMSPPGNNSIRWLTRIGINNLDHVEDPTVWFRMKLFNNINTSAYIYSSAAYIDNNMPPTIQFDQITIEQTDSIYFNVLVSDEEEDFITFVGEYSLNDIDWFNTTLLSEQDTLYY
jgi:hypothetical protein